MSTDHPRKRPIPDLAVPPQGMPCHCYRTSCERCHAWAADHVWRHRFDKAEGHVAEFLANDDDVAGDMGAAMAVLEQKQPVDPKQHLQDSLRGFYLTAIRFDRWIFDGIKRGTLVDQQLAKWEQASEAERDEDADRRREGRKVGEVA